MIFSGYDKDGQQTCRITFDYVRNTGLHNGVLLYRDTNPHPIAALTAVLGDKEATLREWYPCECVDVAKQSRVHHWRISS